MRSSDLAIYVFLAAVVFSPTINFAGRTSVVEWLAFATVACAIADVLVAYPMRRAGTTLSLVMLGAAVAVAPVPLLFPTWPLSPAKLLGILMVALIAPAAFDAHRNVLHRIAMFALAVNLVFTVFQLIGLSYRAYIFVDYANDAAPIDLVENTRSIGELVMVPYLPQLRPSGAFPAPTYLSLFCIYVWHQLIVAKPIRSRLVLAGTGALFVGAGSTVGTFLIAAALPFIRSKPRLLYFFGGAGAALVLYAWALPYHYRYNYNYADVVLSFLSRLNVAAGGESVLQQNPLLFAVGCLLAIFAALLARRVNILKLAIVAVAIALPVMVHDVTSSLLYWLVVFLTLRADFGLRFLRTETSDRQIVIARHEAEHLETTRAVPRSQ